MFYPLVSVIIPVYQAEKFLTECVESVRKQDYSELEIVLVNDGSTDRSNQMCEELAAADPRIRVIHQNNKGSGAARNAGIKEATGKYLLFLDADDKLDDSSAIRSLAARAEREQADIVIGTYRRWRANGAVIWKKKTRTAQSSGFMDFFKKERFLTTGENSTANLFWSLTICGFPHTVTPKTRHIILDAVHAIRNMLLSHRASFFTVKISSP